MAVVFVTIAPLGTGTPSVSKYVAGVNLSYEVDLFGRLAKEIIEQQL